MKTIFITILMVIASISTQEAIMHRMPVEKFDVKWMWPARPIEAMSTQERIVRVLSDSGISVRMQQILLAQADYESGGFKNSLTKKWNNVYSMLHSRRDPYSLGNWGYAEGRSGYSVYLSIENSVCARLWYSRSWKYPADTTVEAYVTHIKSRGYFTGDAKEYLAGMQARMKKNEALWQVKIKVEESFGEQTGN
jgi:hypothetical protein